MKPKRISILFTFFFTMCFFGLTHCDKSSNEAYLDNSPQPVHQIDSKISLETPALHTKTAQPIRVTFDNEEMKESFPQYYEFFDKILKVTSNLLSKLIKVKRLTTANKYNNTFYVQQQTLCKKKKVS